MKRAVGIEAAAFDGCDTILLVDGGDKGAHVQLIKSQADKKGIA